jgi:hypothetical protein
VAEGYRHITAPGIEGRGSLASDVEMTTWHIQMTTRQLQHGVGGGRCTARARATWTLATAAEALTPPPRWRSHHLRRQSVTRSSSTRHLLCRAAHTLPHNETCTIRRHWCGRHARERRRQSIIGMGPTLWSDTSLLLFEVLLQFF